MVRPLIPLYALLLFPAQEAFAQSRRTTQPTTYSQYSLSGKVILADGGPVTDPVEVILVCNGTIRQRVYSRADGQFVFTLGENRSPDTDSAEMAGNPIGGEFRSFNQIGRGFGDDGRWGSGRTTQPGRLYLGDCELFALHPGFTSEVVYPGNRDVLGKPDIGNIRLFRRAQVRGTTISLKSLTAPDKARNAYEKARSQLKKKKPAYSMAIKELQKAVQLYPEFAEAWHYLGKSYLALKEVDKAREAYEQSARADADYLLPRLALAELDMKCGQFSQAAIWSGQVLERNAHLIRASYLYGHANFSLGNLDLAEASLRKVQTSPEAKAYPGTHYLLGMVLARKGDIPAAASELSYFLELNPNFDGAEELRDQLKLWANQGLVAAAKPQIR